MWRRTKDRVLLFKKRMFATSIGKQRGNNIYHRKRNGTRTIDEYHLYLYRNCYFFQKKTWRMDQLENKVNELVNI